MTDQDILKVWDEVVGVDVGIDPVPFARAILDAAPSGDINHIAQVLACEIECGVFEQHVAPALEIARKALAPTQGSDAPLGWCWERRYTNGGYTRKFCVSEFEARELAKDGGNLAVPDLVYPFFGRAHGADARPVATFEQVLESAAYGGIPHNDARIRCARAVYDRLIAARDAAPSDGLSDSAIAEMAYKQFGIVAEDSEVIAFARAVIASIAPKDET